MTFAEAAAYIIPYGKYRGRTIDVCATTDEGLKWLDYMRGEREQKAHSTIESPFLVALRTYLDEPAIAGELSKLVGRGAQS